MATTSGFARDLMLTSEQVFKGANPETKITAPGFLQMCSDAAKPQIISAQKDQSTGLVRDIKLKYRSRATAGNSSNTYSCDADNFRLWNETYVTQSLFRQIAINFDFDTVAKLEAEAIQMRNAPGAPASLGGIMNVVWDAIASEMNGLLADMNIDLLTKMNLNWGYNATTGLNTAKTLNFPLATTTNDLTAGITGLLYDAQYNEIDINSCAVVGNGFIANYYIQNILKGAISTAQNGLNSSMLGMPKFYQDYYTVSNWGANKFGLVDMQALQFLDLNVNQGFKATTLGTSTYFMMPIQLMTSAGTPFTMNFDVQIKTIDCPTSINNRYGSPITVGPGYIVYIRKPFDIFVQPGNTYGATDRLAGNNGTLKYTATNS